MITNNGTIVKFRREFKAPVNDVFQAWSDPNIFKSWWKDISVAELDFKVGGAYLLKWASIPDDYSKGIYKEIVPNEKIVMTWITPELCGPKNASFVTDSTITLNFKAVDARTSEFELIHEFLPVDRIDDHSWGWAYAMVDMDKYFNGPKLKVQDNLRVNLSRTMPASAEKVWDAWTNPAMLQRWFNSKGATVGTASATLKVGGSFFLDYQFKNGDLHRIYGSYREIEPMKKLVFSWIDDNTSDVKIDKSYISQVTVTLTPEGNNKTIVQILHDQLRHESGMKEFESGWGSCLPSIEEELLADQAGAR